MLALGTRDGSLGNSRYRFADEAIVFLVALAARVGVVVFSGGFRGNYGYDASVYYAAGDALTNGRIPYRDFVLLHPPALMLVVAPFAWLGRLTSDQHGFIAANLAFTVLGAVNAVLVVRVAKTMKLGRRPAVLGGYFYAVWFGSVGAEYLIRLEPLGNFCVLTGLIAFFAAEQAVERPRTKRLRIVTGLAFGAATSVKIWWAAPLLLVLAWHRRPSGSWRDAGYVAVGAAISLIAINGPFLLLAPSQMWHMVVSAQLGRDHDSVSALARLRHLIGVDRLTSHLPHAMALVATALVGVLAMTVLIATLTSRSDRLVGLLVLVQVAVLAIAPSWFTFYADYPAPAISLSIAAALAVAYRRMTNSSDGSRRILKFAWVPIALAGGASIVVLVLGESRSVSPFPGAQLAGSVRHERCVMSDSPMALIELESLSRDLEHGCANWIDVSGRSYGADVQSLTSDGSRIARTANRTWQRKLRAYLLSGDAVVLIRPGVTGVSEATRAAVTRGGVLARSGSVVIYRRY